MQSFLFSTCRNNRQETYATQMLQLQIKVSRLHSPFGGNMGPVKMWRVYVFLVVRY
jgi:hypothetical protein